MPPGGERPIHDPAATLREVAASLVNRHAPVITGLIGLDETVLALDGALLRRLGYDADDWVGRRVSELVPYTPPSS